MMNISDCLEHTCSMAELGNVDTTKALSKSLLEKIIEDKLSSDSEEPKVLIYNTTSSSIKFLNSLSRLGFEKVFEYSGNTKGKSVKVYILDLKVEGYI